LALTTPTPPDFEDHADRMGLGSLVGIDADRTPAVDEFLALVEESFQRRRKFVLGLAVSFIALAERALSILDEDSVEDVFGRFSHQETTAAGGPVNTLNLILSDNETVRLRPLYNEVEHVVRADLRRYDYPHMPGHATQAWRQHQRLIELVFAMSTAERRAVAEAMWERILAEFPEFRRRSTADALPRPFETILEDFPNTQQGEPAGAVLQGLAFAYYRADSPNVTIETGKVGAGSRRAGRIADVDGWSGDELVLSIEVKDEDIDDPDDDTLDGFIGNLAEWPDALAIVVARDATEEVVAALAEQNVKVLTREVMLEAVLRWDLNKQLLAAREFLYYLSRVQKNSRLVDRLREFLDEHDIAL
jgi:hypothetical protein